jgi:hypothetical protein
VHHQSPIIVNWTLACEPHETRWLARPEISA